MAVLIYELREYSYVRWTVKHWCHMVSDESFDELHAFAARLGIPRERVRRHHSALPPIMRARAVAQGAEQVTISELARRMTGPRGDRHRARRARRARRGAGVSSSGWGFRHRAAPTAPP